MFFAVLFVILQNWKKICMTLSRKVIEKTMGHLYEGTPSSRSTEYADLYVDINKYTRHFSVKILTAEQ